MSSTTSFYAHAASLMNAATNDTNCDNPVPQGYADWAVQNNYPTSLGDARRRLKVAPITQRQVNAARITTSLPNPASVSEKKTLPSFDKHSKPPNFTKKTRSSSSSTFGPMHARAPSATLLTIRNSLT